ncbi:hypothetical protein [Bradyrhizobium sp. S3.2.6]|uniref:hypothetical protein n=1 Tax=Bradyrhizobium sp. S3.2.6 TaxID=3156428 RepID=UPI0033992C06
MVVERGGPTLFARIGVMRALNRHHEFNPNCKEPLGGPAEVEEGSMTVFKMGKGRRVVPAPAAAIPDN